MVITLLLIVITVAISLAALNNAQLLHKLIMFPYGMKTPSEYYRMLTSGFIHEDYNHLFFNMFSMYFFGRNAENIFGQLDGSIGSIYYLVLYLTAIVISSLPAFIKHKNNRYYRSLGASGGVSAIMFFVIYFFPWSKIQFFFVPMGIPAILYALLYSIYSAYMSKKGNDNIGHDAHLGGAAYGFLFAFLVDPTHGRMFLDEITHPSF